MLEGCQSEWARIDAKLDGVCTEEATFIFSGVDWEAPFQGSLFEVIEGLLNSVSSFQWIRGGEPDKIIISIECVIGSLWEGPGEVVNI